jgi:outer membrane protein TolC
MKKLTYYLAIATLTSIIFNPPIVKAENQNLAKIKPETIDKVQQNNIENLKPHFSPLLFPTQPEEVKVTNEQAITLEQAIELAKTNNRDLQVNVLNIEKSKAAVKEAKSANFPTIDLNAEYSIDDSASGQITNSSRKAFNLEPNNTYSVTFSGNAQLNYDFYTGGRRPATIEAAEKQLRFDQLELERKTEQLKLDVSNAYYDLQQADEEVIISEAAVRNSQQSLKDTQALERAGIGTKFDVLRAEVQLSNSKQDLVQAKSQQRIARRKLTQILGLSQNAEVTAAEPIEKGSDWKLSLEETIVLAYKNRAEIEQQLVQGDISEQRRKIALATRKPQLSLFATYNLIDAFEDQQGPGDGYSIGARLRWSLFDGGQAKAQGRQQEINKEIAKTQLADNRNQIRLQIEQAYFTLEANAQNIESTILAVSQAEESLKLANLRFKAGVGTQTDVINAETELTRAKVNKLRAILGYNRALASLQRGVSNFPDNKLFKRP